MIYLMKIKGRRRDLGEYQDFYLDGWWHGEKHSSVWVMLTPSGEVQQAFSYMHLSSGKPPLLEIVVWEFSANGENSILSNG